MSERPARSDGETGLQRTGSGHFVSRRIIRSLGGGEGVRLLSVYYLLNHSDRYVQRQEIADWIGCHPRSVKLAMDTLLKDEVWSGHLEVLEAKNAVLYKMKQADGEAPRFFKRIFDLIERQYVKFD